MPDYAARHARLRAALSQAGVDAALVTRLVNVRYLTGFTGSHAALLVTADGALLATDGRYEVQAGTEAPDVERMIDRAVGPVLVDRAVRTGVRRLGFEAGHVTVAAYDGLRDALDGRGDLVGLDPVVEGLRSVKDDDELDLLRRACAISDQALLDVLAGVAPGRTERDLARRLEARMLDLGAEGPAFPTIVAAGPHAAIPHHRPTDRPVERGELLVVDFGARYAGYHADCTRTVLVGARPAGWQAEVYALVQAAQRAGREALRPGASAAEVDEAARRVIRDAGYGDQFVHGLGHGVGLEIHEAPLLLGTETAARLTDRTPVTVEPGVYLAGRGGVRIEDTLVVRDPAGAPHAELLTTTTKELLVLG